MFLSCTLSAAGEQGDSNYNRAKRDKLNSPCEADVPGRPAREVKNKKKAKALYRIGLRGRRLKI